MKLIFPTTVILFLVFGCLGINQPQPSNHTGKFINTSLEPNQLKTVKKPFEFNVAGETHIIKPRAEYEISGEVASKAVYEEKISLFRDWNTRLSPLDLCLIWGDAATEESKKHVRYIQTIRACFFEYDADTPLDRKYLTSHESNNHIIPANPNIKKAVLRLKENEKVRLKGQLVDIDSKIDGGTYWWKTSLKRTDSGDGSCEVFYVEEVQIDDKIYK